MKIQKMGLFLSLVLFFGVLFFCVSTAQAAVEAEKAAALSLFSNKQYTDALTRYMNLLRQEPDDPEINLMLARSARMVGKLNLSRMSYDRLMLLVPRDPALRLEYAELLIALEEPEAAAAEVAEARRLSPDLDKGRLAARAKAMERNLSTFLVNGKLTVGVLYDSNMNNAPDNRGINIGGIPLELAGEDTEQETFGTFLNLRVNGAWRSNPHSKWWIVGDATGYQRWNTKTDPRRDLTYGRGAIGLQHLTPKRLMEVRVKAETLLENEDTSVAIFGGEFNSVFVLSRAWQNIGRFGVEYRNDHRIDDRSGTYWFVSDHLRYFFGEKGHSVTFGGKLYGSDTDAARFDYLGVEVSSYLNFKLPQAFSLTSGLAFRHEQYDDRPIVFASDDRDDDQWRFSLFLNKQFTPVLSMDAGWQYVNSHSNSDFFDYDQHLVVISVSYAF